MTKEVLVAIKGLQFDGFSDETEIETVTAGEYYKRNNSHYVVYEELFEGSQETTKNIVKFKENSLDLMKKGLVNVHMVFEENKKNMSTYSTPYGDIMVGIDAKRISMQESEEEIRVNVEYELELNYEHMADCSLTMNIHSKEECRASL